MIDSKCLKDQQDKDAFNKYFSSIIDKINKNNVDNKINDEILSTFHYYLKQITFTPLHLWFLKLFQPEKLHL